MNNKKLREELAALLRKNRKRILEIWAWNFSKIYKHPKVKNIIIQKLHMGRRESLLKTLIYHIRHPHLRKHKSDSAIKRLMDKGYFSNMTIEDVTHSQIILRTLLSDLLVQTYKDDFKKLKGLIKLIGMEIDNNMLYFSRTYRRRDFFRLKTIIRYGKKLIKLHDLNRVCNLVLESAIKESDSDKGCLMLLEKDGYLHIKSSIGIPDKTVLAAKKRTGTCIAGKAVKTAQPIIINKSYAANVSTAVYIPIYADSTIAGVLNLEKHNKPFFDENDVELLLILAHEAGEAIANCHLIKDMQELYLGSIISLAAAIDTRDHYTRGHSDNVARLATSTARALKLPKEAIENIRFASLLHDIGKIGIPDKILLKPEKLSRKEFTVIKKHPVYGARILRHIPRLKIITPIIYHEHEHYNGKGYVKGLRGEDIPIESRVISVADAYEAMTSNRPYRKALCKKEAVKELKRCSGIQFDPKIVKAFLKIIEK